MDIRQALIKHLAFDLFHEHGLTQQGWTFVWDSGKRRAGACHYTTKTISGSRYILPMATDEEVQEVLLHEIAHALTPGHHHDSVWRRKLIAIGGTGARTHRMETVRGRYDLTCINCGVIGDRHIKGSGWNVPRYHQKCLGEVRLVDTRSELTTSQGYDKINVMDTNQTTLPSTGPVCAHGCGMTTKGGKYLPGHDAKHVANLAADIKYGALTPALAFVELASSPNLHNKLARQLHKMDWVYDADTQTWNQV